METRGATLHGTRLTNNEFMNLEVKLMKPNSPRRIDKSIAILNGLRAADGHLRRAVGAERTDPDEYTPVKAHHVQSIVDALKRKLGASHAALFAPIPVTTNPFGTPTKPWAHVKKTLDCPAAQPTQTSPMRPGHG